MRSRFKIALPLASAACAAALALVGCSAGVQEEAPEPEAPVYDMVIGQESPDTANLLIENETGRSIVGIQVKAVDATDLGPNVMAEDQVWDNGLVADVFFDGVAAPSQDLDASEGEATSSGAQEADASESGEASDDASAEEVLLSPVYDVHITYQDETTSDLHQLNLASLMSAENVMLRIDPASGITYLTYVQNGEEASTLMFEQQLVAEAEAAAQAQAEAEAAAAAEAEAEAQAAARTSRSSRGSGSGGYDSVDSGSYSAPSQTEDSCVNVDELAFND